MPLVDGLVAGAVADGDGIDAYMGGDGAADGAGAGVYVVLARERLADELLLLGGAGVSTRTLEPGFSLQT